MAKFYGKIGYIETKETSPGVWTEVSTERDYFGDVINRSSRWQSSQDKQNDDLQVTNQISIVADPYALNNFSSMRYVEWMGALWKINSVSVEYPRLTLEIGGVYNEDPQA